MSEDGSEMSLKEQARLQIVGGLLYDLKEVWCILQILGECFTDEEKEFAEIKRACRLIEKMRAGMMEAARK